MYMYPWPKDTLHVFSRVGPNWAECRSLDRVNAIDMSCMKSVIPWTEIPDPPPSLFRRYKAQAQ